MDLLENAVVFLIAGLIGVFFFKRIGLGSVLGYLFAGVLIGPHALAFIDEYEEILQFAELGVVFLLFVIGLELSPKRLWQFRHLSLGYGGLQVTITALILFFPLYFWVGLPQSLSIVLSFGLALSSTAMVLQILSERDELSTTHGQASFGTLLFQDMAAIPLIAILPFLATESSSHLATTDPMSLLEPIAILMVAALSGVYLTEPVLRAVARLKVPELLLAASLAIVLGLALLMHSVGLSMALGSFLGGVVLSNSSYRHQLETNIEPFKSLLMGLFFIAIGMSVEITLLIDRPFIILFSLIGLMTMKFAVASLLLRAFKKPWGEAFNTGSNLCQVGEFVFILVTIALEYSLMDSTLASMFKIVIGLSMLSTPIVIQSVRYLVLRNQAQEESDLSDIDTQLPTSSRVIVVGYGRFGQIVSRILRAKKIPTTVIDNNADHIRFVKKFGSHVFFGDAKNVELLKNAGAERAEILVIAIDKTDDSLALVRVAKEQFPHLKIFARARNRQHLLALQHYEVDYCIRDTYLSALAFSEQVLQVAGLTFSSASDAVRIFKDHDRRILEAQADHWQDEQKLGEITKQWTAEMEKILESDTRSD